MLSEPLLFSDGADNKSKAFAVHEEDLLLNGVSSVGF